MSVTIHQQLHGYRNGHQLLKSSVRLELEDQDMIDHLSDIAGPIRPGQRFDAYISAYPLPSSKYYALAKTEQDVDAPRAGCVTTKTLLVPAGFWGHEASPAALAVFLDPSTDADPIVNASRLPVPTLSPVYNPVLPELVEALLLEIRRDIVVFGAPFPIEIPLRLLTAFWPEMRNDFSLCTFALSPRTLAGKSFDLLFVPEAVRDRFSDWAGRRIDVEEGSRSSRHRWTGILMERIFGSATPHLADVNSLRALVVDGTRNDEDILRLSLLWDELREKVEISPSAVLGLIDIASSRDTVGSIWEALEPVVAGAVTTAAESLETEEAWGFLSTLLGKLRRERITGPISEALCSSGAKLSQRDWRSALDFLGTEASVTSRGSDRALLESIASAVARVDVDQLTHALLAMCAQRLIGIALLDEGLLSCIFAATDRIVDATLTKTLGDGFESLSSEERSLGRNRLLRCIRGDQDSRLLVQIVADAETSELVEAVNLVWNARPRRTTRLGEALCAAALAGGSRCEVRNAFARLGSDVQTIRCVDRLVAAEPGDVMWLLDSSEIGERATFFLSSLIRRTSSEELQRAFCVGEVATRAIEVLLASDLRLFGAEAVRIVVLPCIPAIQHIDLGLQIYPMVDGSERTALAQSLAIRVLTDATVQGGDVPERVIAAVIDDVDLRVAIERGLATERTGRDVSRTLVALDRADPAVVRRIVEPHVPLIVQLVASRAVFDFSVDGAAAISRFLETAARSEGRTYVELCSTILPFAMGTRREAASRIVVAAFPTVYEELRKDRVDFRLIDFFGLFEWDKCKIARKDLVRSFMRSEWPPVDLAVTALRACELRRILRRLLKEPGGVSYLAQIEEGVQRLERRIRRPILDTIREVQDSLTQSS